MVLVSNFNVRYVRIKSIRSGKDKCKVALLGTAFWTFVRLSTFDNRSAQDYPFELSSGNAGTTKLRLETLVVANRVSYLGHQKQRSDQFK